MSRFAAPHWRVLGSIVSWLLFSVSFTLLYMGSAVVMGLGGFCASGGPYVIETECPDAVVAYVPLSIFGGLAAAAIGALISWAWPVLFGGLGTAFLVSSTQPGAITFLIIGILFVVMGLGPLVLEFRASPQRLFLGSTNVADVNFVEAGRARPSLTQFSHWGSRETNAAIPARAGDWVLSLGILVASVGLGIYLATLLWQAAGG
jgi:hypothetical protein